MSEIKRLFKDGDMVLWKREDGTHLCSVIVENFGIDEQDDGFIIVQGEDEDVAWGIFNLDGTPPDSESHRNDPNQYQSPHISLELVPGPTLFGEPFKYPTGE